MPKKRISRNKRLLPVLHVFCEGEKTEPNYIKGYLNKFHSCNRRLKIVIIENTNKSTPVQLVDDAYKIKKDSKTPKNDVFWVVYDREGKHNYKDSLHQQAFERARSHKINIAISSVCFEIWLLLHLVESNASYSSCDDLLKNSPLQNELQKLGLAKYEKGCQDIFERISGNIDDARSRAIRMNTATLNSSNADPTRPYLHNPYTDMHLLLDEIDRFFRDL